MLLEGDVFGIRQRLVGLDLSRRCLVEMCTVLWETKRTRVESKQKCKQQTHER